MRQYFALKVSMNALLQRNALGVAQLRVGLGVAVSVTTDLSRLITFAECCEHNSQFGRGEAHVASAIGVAQVREKGAAVLVDRISVPCRDIRKQLSDRRLPVLAFRNFREPCLLVLLVARRELGEDALGLNARNPLHRGLEVQA